MSSHPSAKRETTETALSPTPERRGRESTSRAREGSLLDQLETVTDLDVLALSTPLGVFRSTREDGLVWVNRRLLEITGLTRDQAMGHDWLRAVHPLDRQRVDDARRDLWAAPHDFSIQYRIVRPEGAVRDVRVRVLPSPERPGEPQVFVGAMEDVTDQIDDPSRFPREDPFRTLVVSSPLGVVYCDSAGRIVYVNDRWLEISGRSAEELLDTDDLRIAHPEDRAAIFESMSAAAQAGEEWFGEMRVLRPDGEVRHTRTSVAAIRRPDGSVEGYVGTLEDVTGEAEDRKRTELALEARMLAEALVAETSRALVTASVEDVDEQVVGVLARLARFVGADSAELAVRRDELAAGTARRHTWRRPEGRGRRARRGEGRGHGKQGW